MAGSLEVGGFSLTCDAWALADDPVRPWKRALWFVSLLGPQQGVRAAWARLLKGEQATVTDRQDFGGGRWWASLPGGEEKGWKSLSASIPGAAAFHLILLPEAADYRASRPDFLLLVREGQNAAELHYRYLNARLDTPLLPGWADFLWERSLNSGETKELIAHGITAYMCRPREGHIRNAISLALRQGKITA